MWEWKISTEDVLGLLEISNIWAAKTQKDEGTCLHVGKPCVSDNPRFSLSALEVTDDNIGRLTRSEYILMTDIYESIHEGRPDPGVAASAAAALAVSFFPPSPDSSAEKQGSLGLESNAGPLALSVAAEAGRWGGADIAVGQQGAPMRMRRRRVTSASAHLGARVTVTGPWPGKPPSQRFGNAGALRGSASALADGPPSPGDRRPGPAIAGVGQGGARRRKVAAELQGCPGRSPRIPTKVQACPDAVGGASPPKLSLLGFSDECTCLHVGKPCVWDHPRFSLSAPEVTPDKLGELKRSEDNLIRDSGESTQEVKGRPDPGVAASAAAALAVSFFPPSPDSSAEKQGSLGLESNAGPLGCLLLHPPGRAVPSAHLAIGSTLPLQPTRIRTSAQGATEVSTIGLLRCLRHAASFPGATSDTAASIVGCRRGGPLGRRGHRSWPAGRANAHAQAARHKRERPPGARVTVTGPWPGKPPSQRFGNAGALRGSASALADGPPSPGDRRPGPAIAGVGQGGARRRKVAAELQGCPGRSPRIPTKVQACPDAVGGASPPKLSLLGFSGQVDNGSLCRGHQSHWTETLGSKMMMFSFQTVKGGQIQVLPPLLPAALAVSFFPPSPDSSAEKQGSLGLESNAGPLATPATPHQTESPAPWDPIPAQAVCSFIHLGEQSRVPTWRSEAPSPLQPTRIRTSAQGATEVSTIGLLRCLRHAASFPGATSDTAASIVGCRRGGPLGRRGHRSWPAGRANAHAQAAPTSAERPPGARVTVTAPVAWETAVPAVWQRRGPPWQCLGVGRRAPISRRSSPGSRDCRSRAGRSQAEKSCSRASGMPRAIPKDPHEGSGLPRRGGGCVSSKAVPAGVFRGGQIQVLPPLLPAALAVSFFPPSPDSSAEKQGSLGLESNAGPLATPATPHQTESPAPWDPIPAQAVCSFIHLGEQSRVPTWRSEAPSPLQPTRIRTSAQGATEVSTIGLLRCLRHAASFPGATSDTAASIVGCRRGGPLGRRGHRSWPAGRANAHAQAARHKRERPPGARVTVTGPVAWETAVPAVWQRRGPPWQCLGVGRRAPISRRSSPGSRDCRSRAGRSQAEKSCSRASGMPRAIPKDPHEGSGLPRRGGGVRLLQSCPCWGFQGCCCPQDPLRDHTLVGGQIQVLPPLLQAALAVSFFPPSPDSSAEKQGSLGLESNAGPLATPATPHQTESPAPWDPIPAQAVCSFIHLGEQSRVPTWRSEAPSPLQPTRIRTSAQGATEVSTIGLLRCLRHAASFPGPPPTPPPALSVAAEAGRWGGADIAVGQQGAPMRMRRRRVTSAERPPGARVTVTGPWPGKPPSQRFGNAGALRGSASALADGPPSPGDRRPGPAIAGVGQGGARRRKVAAELQGCPGRSPRIPTKVQACPDAVGVRLLQSCPCWGFQGCCCPQDPLRDHTLVGGQIQVLPPLLPAALAVSFFPPSPDSSAEKQGSLGLESNAGPLATPATPHQTESPAPWDPIPAQAVCSFIHLGEQSRVPTWRSEAPSPLQPTRIRTSAQGATEVSTIGLLRCLRHAASFPGATSDTAASIVGCRRGGPLGRRGHRSWPAGRANAHAQAARHKRERPPGARVTVTGPWPGKPPSQRFGNAGALRGSASALADGPPSPGDRRPGPAIAGVGQGGARRRKVAAELQGCPGRSPRIPTKVQACPDAVGGCVSSKAVPAGVFRGGQIQVLPPLLPAALAVSFFPPSPDSSAEKQGSLGLESNAGPLGGWPRWKGGSELMEPGIVLPTPARRVSGMFLGSSDPRHTSPD
ncbi:hypothetical protein AAY473_013059 [Plecturocebus cupreus]